MEIIRQQMTFSLPESIVVFGNFDGVHKGHQLLLEKALEKERELGFKTAFFTFEPHPVSVVTGKPQRDLIFTTDEKMQVVEAMGIDYYIEYPFTMEVAKTAPEVFIDTVIRDQLKARVVIVGEDFRFGSRRAGDVAMLKAYGELYNFQVIDIQKLCFHDRCYSSTWLRERIKEGEMEAYIEMTGRPFRVNGIVEHGRALGRTIGYPTANVATPVYKLLPPKGVYASYTIVDGVTYKSITNVGEKPGGEEDEMVVETYILDFSRMIYGEEIQIDMVHFLRPEIKLQSMDHLKSLIDKDLNNLEAYFESLE